MANTASPHPLDDCDPAECYQTMMSERTALITARREAEDGLIKTVIQLAAALLAILAGFMSQTDVRFSIASMAIFAGALASLVVAIVAGLKEQRYSSTAYLAQQKLVEDYFQKKIATFDEPSANTSVRKAQTTAFTSFVFALALLAILALVEVGEKYVEREHPVASAATSTSAAAAATTTSPAAAATSPASTSTARDQDGRQRSGTVSGPVNAATPTSEEVRPAHGQE